MNWLKRNWFVVLLLVFVVSILVVSYWLSDSMNLAACGLLLSTAKILYDHFEKQREQAKKEAEKEEKITATLSHWPHESLKVTIYNSGKADVTIKRVALCITDQNETIEYDGFHTVIRREGPSDFIAEIKLTHKSSVLFRYFAPYGSSYPNYHAILDMNPNQVILKVWSFEGERLCISGEDIQKTIKNGEIEQQKMIAIEQRAIAERQRIKEAKKQADK